MTLLYGQTDDGALVPIRVDDSGRIVTIIDPVFAGDVYTQWLTGTAPGPIGIRYEDGPELRFGEDGSLSVPYRLSVGPNGSPVLTVSETGQLAVSGPLDVGAASIDQSGIIKGMGLDLTGAVGSGNPRVLDWYEEGSWIPALLADSGSPTVSYALRTGTYIRIGRMVYVRARIQVTSHSGGVGPVSIGNLPFPASSSVPGTPVAVMGNVYGILPAVNVASFQFGAGSVQGQIALRPLRFTNASGQATSANLTYAEIAQAWGLSVQVTYEV